MGATAFSIFCLVVFVLLGPSAEEVNKKFEYIGVPGELNIMDAISIVDGKDQINQLPKSLQKPPPPNIMEIEDEETYEDGVREVPKPKEMPNMANPVEQEVVDETAREFTRDVVSMATPMQTSDNYYIINRVLPEYPLDASETERQTKIIFVKVAFYIAPDGTVSDCMIQDTNGSAAFINEVLTAMKQWLIGFHRDPGPGLWLQTTWNFKSSYFNHFQDSGG